MKHLEVQMEEFLEKEIAAVKRNLEVIKKTLDSQKKILINIAGSIRKALENGNKILIFGNGGSAADAQHFAAEMVGRFKRDRKGYPAIALTTDSSAITAIGNDYGFEAVFSRQVEALGSKGDVAIGISTSGKSQNVVLALKEAKKIGMAVFAVTGGCAGELAEIADITIEYPGSETPRIQEYHTVVFHILAAIIDSEEIRKKIPEAKE
jgi:D-sedoheptulose 7-phosphate isomerase